jgi:hypothetical protein
MNLEEYGSEPQTLDVVCKLMFEINRQVKEFLSRNSQLVRLDIEDFERVCYTNIQVPRLGYSSLLDNLVANSTNLRFVQSCFNASEIILQNKCEQNPPAHLIAKQILAIEFWKVLTFDSVYGENAPHVEDFASLTGMSQTTKKDYQDVIGYIHRFRWHMNHFISYYTEQCLEQFDEQQAAHRRKRKLDDFLN